ncbi:PAP2 superfamily protein [Candidatus Tiddalikarchaeum anstoanum]|nr:PAP2 superfamily protein [Candidatus Tiddalikarchaeum anstoanum]
MLSAALLVLFCLLIISMFTNNQIIQTADLAVHEWAKTVQSNPLTNVMIIVSETFDIVPMIIASIIVLIFLIRNREYTSTTLFSIGLLGGLVIETVIKQLIARPRPFDMLISEASFGFPSAHSTMALLFFSLIIIIFGKRIKDAKLRAFFTALNVLLILMVCLNRLYLNVHWLSDVIGGLLIGGFWLTIALLLSKKLVINYRTKIA